MRRKKHQKTGDHVPKVINQATRAKATGIMPPGLYLIDVRHDDHCALLHGQGPCDCHPDVGTPRPYFSPEDN